VTKEDEVASEDSVDQSFVEPSAPRLGRPWPRPTETVYPMKRSDDVLPDGTLVSGARRAVKAEQHEHRVVLRWRERQKRWVVARPRLRARSLADMVAPDWVEFCRQVGLDPTSSHWVGLCAVAEAHATAIFLEHSVQHYRENLNNDEPQLVLGDPGEVVVTVLRTLDDDVIEVAEFGVVWLGHHPMAMRRQEGRVFIDISSDQGSLDTEVASAIRSIRERRRQRYQRCIRCGRMTPPEWWSGRGHCQSCASEHLGVVY